jgi:hypothetical protein
MDPEAIEPEAMDPEEVEPEYEVFWVMRVSPLPSRHRGLVKRLFFAVLG